MNKRFGFYCFLSLTVVLLAFQAFGLSWVRAASPAAIATWELIDTVNALRSSNGRTALITDNQLMVAAQLHSDYQAAVGYWTHQGAGGTDETARAAAAGYGGGKAIRCDEAVAVASDNRDAAYIVYTLWGDYVHREVVLLNTRYVHIGAGASRGSDGLWYYTVKVCVIDGQSPANPTPASGTTQQPGSTPVAGTREPITTATPQEDGAIRHLVQPGETLWEIALSYGTTVLSIASLNNISPSNPQIYARQVLLIYRAPTPTNTPTNTTTPPPPTRTPRPTQTPLPTRVTSTPKNTPTVTPTATPLPEYYQFLDQITRQQWGMIIIGVSLLGILFLFGIRPSSARKASQEIEEEQEPQPVPDEPYADASETAQTEKDSPPSDQAVSD
jgi:LysM repeat protein